MDHESLRTASTYLNNLLLARGLLRNGDAIDFVKPSKESRAQIINLVHDLILREDRDKDQREGTAHTLRQLRAEDARKQHEIERLTSKSEESARAAAQAQAAERAAHAEVKKVERAVKALQDQSAKLKTTLAQVKTQCTNDVRKRDLELARLKTHLQGQQRGNRVGMAAPTMTVRKPTTEATARDVGDPEYSLRQETTEFLTQLSQSLSDENDNLISLIRNALSTLRELLGLPANSRRHPDSAVGSMGSEEDLHGKNKNGGNDMVHALSTSYEAMTADVETCMSHLKTILTNPNFVSMEEVEVREEEIARLREGWEHMEHRLRDVLLMMQGWLKRMTTGEGIDIDDLRQGMGLVSPDRTRVDEQSDVADHSLVDSETSSIKLDGIDGPSAVTLSPLRHAASSIGSPKRKRDILEPPDFFDLRPATSSNKSAATSSAKPRNDPESVQNRATTLLHEVDDESEELEIPQMTIAEKLSAAQEEAEVAAAAKASRRLRVPAGAAGAMDVSASHDKDDDTLGKMQSPMGKRTKIRGRPRKRKSTLSPEELETLICADDDGF